MTPPNDLEALKKLLEQMPEGLEADWQYTNHYEIYDKRSEAESYWWLCVSDVFADDNPSQTGYGKKLGLVMDVACAARNALPALIKELEAFRALIELAKEDNVERRKDISALQAELEESRKEVERLESGNERLAQECARIEANAVLAYDEFDEDGDHDADNATSVRIAELEDALRFYAEKKHFGRDTVNEGTKKQKTFTYVFDEGEVARKALEAKK